MVRLLLALRLSRASVLLSKLLLWSPDIDGESGALARGHARALAAYVGLGNVELAKGGKNASANLDLLAGAWSPLCKFGYKSSGFSQS